MNQETAANLSVELRVAAYASAHGLDSKEALLDLAERGLSHVLEQEMRENGPEWMPPIYLYASYLRLLDEVDDAR